MRGVCLIMSTEVDQLETRINRLKKELIQKAEETGLNSRETLSCSQKLDQLINIHQRGLLKGEREYITRGNLCVF